MDDFSGGDCGAANYDCGASYDAGGGQACAADPGGYANPDAGYQTGYQDCSAATPVHHHHAAADSGSYSTYYPVYNPYIAGRGSNYSSPSFNARATAGPARRFFGAIGRLVGEVVGVGAAVLGVGGTVLGLMTGNPLLLATGLASVLFARSIFDALDGGPRYQPQRRAGWAYA